jgi:hypothetical protein
VPKGVGGFWWQYRARDNAADGMREPLASRGHSCQPHVSRRRPGLTIACHSTPAEATEHGPQGILGTVSQRHEIRGRDSA